MAFYWSGAVCGPGKGCVVVVVVLLGVVRLEVCWLEGKCFSLL